MKRFGGGVLLFFLMACPAWSEPPSPQQSRVLQTSVTRSVRLPYLLFLPAAYSEDEKVRWPLILYLHGGSLRGGDIERLRTLGLPHKLEGDRNFPFVVVSPHCAEGEIWTDADAIASLLDQVTHDCRIDPARVYVTGHSMGGRGALYFACRLPARFAAVLALSPYSPITTWADELTQTPLWIFHGTEDNDAPISDTKELVERTEKAGGHPRFTALEGRDHFILDVYERPEIYDWLARQKRPVTNAHP